MAKEFLAKPEDFSLFKLEEYIEFIVEFTTRLRPNLIIERFAGEVPPRFLLTPPWQNLRYDQLLSLIEKKMVELGYYQGMRWK